MCLWLLVFSQRPLLHQDQKTYNQALNLVTENDLARDKYLKLAGGFAR